METRQMTQNEIFESRIEYFFENRQKFTEKESKIIISIISQYNKGVITQKQNTLFLSIVDATWSTEIHKQKPRTIKQ